MKLKRVMKRNAARDLENMVEAIRNQAIAVSATQAPPGSPVNVALVNNLLRLAQGGRVESLQRKMVSDMVRQREADMAMDLCDHELEPAGVSEEADPLH